MKKIKKIILFLIIFTFCSVLVLASLSASATELEVGILKKTSANGIADYISLIYAFAGAAVGGLAVVMILIGAIMYSASAGNKGGIALAKSIISSAIVGLVIVVMSYLILATLSPSIARLNEPDIPTDIETGVNCDEIPKTYWPDYCKEL